MQTHTTHAPAVLMPGYRALTDAALADLDAYDTAISELDTALTDAARERGVIQEMGTEMALIEAHVSLSVEGKNEAERKARLTVHLARDKRYQDELGAARMWRTMKAESEHRAAVARERCRLIRAALALVAVDR